MNNNNNNNNNNTANDPKIPRLTGGRNRTKLYSIDPKLLRNTEIDWWQK